MLTSDKAICEMNTGELAEEYEYCMKSAESEAKVLSSKQR